MRSASKGVNWTGNGPECVRAAVLTGDTKAILSSYLSRVARSLEVPRPQEAAEAVLEAVGAGEYIDDAEIRCKELLGLGFRSTLPRNLAAARASVYVKQIGPWVRGCEVLDLGCGNGFIGRGLHERFGCKVTFADTVLYGEQSGADVVEIEGHALPFEDGSFDAVVIVTALHHMQDPLRELREAARVTRRTLVVKESVVRVGPGDVTPTCKNDLTSQFVSLGYRDQLLYTCFVDWFYNRVLETGIDTPFGFRSTDEWVDIMAQLGSIRSVQEFGIDDVLGALYHVLIAVDTNDTARLCSV